MATPRSKVLVLNAGSSSLKFKVYQWLGAGAGAAGGAPAADGGTPQLQPLAAGLCERIGDPAGGAVMRVRACLNAAPLLPMAAAAGWMSALCDAPGGRAPLLVQ